MAKFLINNLYKKTLFMHGFSKGKGEKQLYKFI